MEKLNLLNLIANGTINSEIAALLSVIGSEQRSFLVSALPRAAGKSTLADAVVDCRPLGVQRHDLSGEVSQITQLMETEQGGYVVVAEFAPHDRGSYIWGARARKALECSAVGYSLAASIHATSMEEAISLVWGDIEAGDDLASAFQYVIYIERFGEGDPDGPNNFYRRVKSIHEVTGVVGGKPNAQSLFFWNESEDDFVKTNQPKLLSRTPKNLEERAKQFQLLVDGNKESAKELLGVLQSAE